MLKVTGPTSYAAPSCSGHQRAATPVTSMLSPEPLLSPPLIRGNPASSGKGEIPRMGRGSGRGAGSCTAGGWSSRSRSRASLPRALAHAPIASGSPTNASPTASGASTTTAATASLSPTLIAQWATRAARIVPTPVTTCPNATPVARARASRRVATDKDRCASRTQPSDCGPAPMPRSCAAYPVTRVAVRATSARARSQSCCAASSIRRPSALTPTCASRTATSTSDPAGTKSPRAKTVSTAATASPSTGTTTRTLANTRSSRSSTAVVRTSARERRPSRAGVSGTSAWYAATRRRARRSRALSCERTRSA